MNRPSPGTATGLTLIGAVARLLNAGLGIEDSVAEVVATLRGGLPARSVTVWLRDSSGVGFWPISAPPAQPAQMIAGLEDLPSCGAETFRCSLQHEGERLGLLEVCFEGAPGLGSDIVQVVADLLSPFVASVELSEDLAYEVAVRSREVEEQRLFTSLIIDSLPVGLYVVDRDYRIQIWNRKRETGTQGLLRDEVVGRPVFEVLTRQDADQLRAEFDQVFESGQISQMELEVSSGSGSEPHFYRISKIPMRLGGDTISHVITIGEDVTEWHSIQQQIMQSEKLAAIGQLAAGVMHEINNPLATINACVAAIDGRLEELTPEARKPLQEYIEIIDKEVQRCTRIVDGLLDFSRPKGKAKRPVHINDLVADTLFLLKHHQRFKRLAVIEELMPVLPPVLANAEQLIQVFMALMLNALDAMEHGGGTLTVRTGLGGHRGLEVMVEFQDTGVGIPRAQLSKIFEPFYTTKPPGRGTGLGLSICYGIVEEHRGRLEADSLPGLGSTFRMFLPSYEGDDT